MTDDPTAGERRSDMMDDPTGGRAEDSRASAGKPVGGPSNHSGREAATRYTRQSQTPQRGTVYSFDTNAAMLNRYREKKTFPNSSLTTADRICLVFTVQQSVLISS